MSHRRGYRAWARVLAVSIVCAVVTTTATTAGAVASPRARAGGVSTRPSTPAAWTVVPSPDPPGVASELQAVSCSGPAMCAAVGNSYPTTRTETALIEQRVNDRWMIAYTPRVPGATDSPLSGVSCATARFCVAAGYAVYNHSGVSVRPLVEMWSGASWSIAALPLPSGTSGASLDEVSCPTIRLCIAVGGYVSSSVEAEYRPLAEEWDGQSWAILQAPNPHAENGSSFSGIGCVSPGPSATFPSCEVVGDYDYADVGQSVFAYALHGATWTPQRQANPLGQELNSDFGVSCVAADRCTSVGSWTGNGPLALAERWDGSRWVRETTPVPASTVTNELVGVSCAAPSACTAVGDSSGTYDDYPTRAMAEQWNGASWRQVPPVSRPGTSTALAGVACTTSTSCVAVGASYDTSGGSTLVEDYRT